MVNNLQLKLGTNMSDRQKAEKNNVSVYDDLEQAKKKGQGPTWMKARKSWQKKTRVYE
jgi:hypothetical protein